MPLKEIASASRGVLRAFRSALVLLLTLQPDSAAMPHVHAWVQAVCTQPTERHAGRPALRSQKTRSLSSIKGPPSTLLAKGCESLRVGGTRLLRCVRVAHAHEVPVGQWH